MRLGMQALNIDEPIEPVACLAARAGADQTDGLAMVQAMHGHTGSADEFTNGQLQRLMDFRHETATRGKNRRKSNQYAHYQLSKVKDQE